MNPYLEEVVILGVASLPRMAEMSFIGSENDYLNFHG